MKRILLVVFVLVVTFAPNEKASAFDWVDWFTHWNLTTAAPTQNPILESPYHEASFTLQDDFGDYYHFNLQQASIDTVLELQPVYMMRIPFYYTEDFSIGGHVTSKLFEEEVTPGGGVSGGGTGFYINKGFGPIVLSGYVGQSSYVHSGDAGKVEPAWSGDPGMYINGRWVEPGEEMSFIASTESGLAWGLSARYNFLPAVYAEIGYEHWGGGTTSGYEYEVDGIRVNVDESKLPRPVTFSEHDFVRIGVGVGF